MSREGSSRDIEHEKVFQETTDPIPMERGFENISTPQQRNLNINSNRRANTHERESIADTVIQIDDSDDEIVNNGRIIKIINKCCKDSNLRSWGFQYDGKTCIREFFDRVSETKRARRISDETLILRFHELLSGIPLLFYRSVRENLHSYQELKKCFFNKFDVIDFDYKTEKFLRETKQRPDQSVTEYVIQVRNLNSKLSMPVSELQLLNIIKYNLSDQYCPCLAVSQITTIDNLLDVCRNYESFILKQETQPSTYRVKAKMNPQHLAAMSTIPVIICSKCGESGHNYKDCSNIPGKICFRCRRPGVTINECFQCRPTVTPLQKN